MIKKIIQKAARFLFVPFAYNSKWYFKVKDIYYTSSAEYLFRFLNLSEKHTNLGENVIVDIGAADGMTSLFFKRRVKNSRVYVFEPNPLMDEKITQNLGSEEGVIVRKLALSNRRGVLDFHRTVNNLSSSILSIDNDQLNKQPLAHQQLLKTADKLEVIATTLDDELANENSILCIKIDVQGYELKVLEGGLHTLQKTKFVLIEMNNHNLYNKGCQYYEVDSFLREHHFKLADILVSYRTANRVLEYDAIYEKIITEQS